MYFVDVSLFFWMIRICLAIHNDRNGLEKLFFGLILTKRLNTISEGLEKRRSCGTIKYLKYETPDFGNQYKEMGNFFRVSYKNILT